MFVATTSCLGDVLVRVSGVLRLLSHQTPSPLSHFHPRLLNHHKGMGLRTRQTSTIRDLLETCIGLTTTCRCLPRGTRDLFFSACVCVQKCILSLCVLRLLCPLCLCCANCSVLRCRVFSCLVWSKSLIVHKGARVSIFTSARWARLSQPTDSGDHTCEVHAVVPT